MRARGTSASRGPAEKAEAVNSWLRRRRCRREAAALLAIRTDQRGGDHHQTVTIRIDTHRLADDEATNDYRAHALWRCGKPGERWTAVRRHRVVRDFARVVWQPIRGGCHCDAPDEPRVVSHDLPRSDQRDVLGEQANHWELRHSRTPRPFPNVRGDGSAPARMHIACRQPRPPADRGGAPEPDRYRCQPRHHHRDRSWITAHSRFATRPAAATQSRPRGSCCHHVRSAPRPGRGVGALGTPFA